jgi:uncharacterized protein (DUF849 family)
VVGTEVAVDPRAVVRKLKNVSDVEQEIEQRCRRHQDVVVAAAGDHVVDRDPLYPVDGHATDAIVQRDSAWNAIVFQSAQVVELTLQVRAGGLVGVGLEHSNEHIRGLLAGGAAALPAKPLPGLGNSSFFDDFEGADSQSDHRVPPSFNIRARL